MITPEGSGGIDVIRRIIIPETVYGKIDGNEVKLYPRDSWSAFGSKGSGIIKDAGRYKIYVGPRVLNENYPDDGKIYEEEFDFPYKIDIILEEKVSMQQKIVECVADEGHKEHTYNKYPANSGAIANFDIENGIIQTGIAYPKSYWGDVTRSKDKHDPFSRKHIDSSSIEFKGDIVDFNTKEYRLLEIIVLN